MLRRRDGFIGGKLFQLGTAFQCCCWCCYCRYWCYCLQMTLFGTGEVLQAQPWLHGLREAGSSPCHWRVPIPGIPIPTRSNNYWRWKCISGILCGFLAVSSSTLELQQSAGFPWPAGNQDDQTISYYQTWLWMEILEILTIVTLQVSLIKAHLGERLGPSSMVRFSLSCQLLHITDNINRKLHIFKKSFFNCWIALKRICRWEGRWPACQPWPPAPSTRRWPASSCFASFDFKNNCKRDYYQTPSMQGSMPRMSEANLNAMFNSYPNYGAR